MKPSSSDEVGTGGQPGLPGSATRRITVGGSVLSLGRPEGTLLTAAEAEELDELGPLTKALEEDDAETRKAPDEGLAVKAEAVVDTASEVTAQTERAAALFNDVAEGRLDPSDIQGEVDVLLVLLGRLDREGRWKEALSLARALSGLLSLIRRWMALVRSLRTGLHAADEVHDLGGIGWAEHELGTLHLAGRRAFAAERRLGRAREIREQLGDRTGLTVTDHNLQGLCRLLRQLLRQGQLTQTGARAPRLRRRWVLAIASLVLLAGAGIAVAMLSDSGGGGESGSQAGPGPDNGVGTPADGGGGTATQPPSVTITSPTGTVPSNSVTFAGTAGTDANDSPKVAILVSSVDNLCSPTTSVTTTPEGTTTTTTTTQPSPTPITLSAAVGADGHWSTTSSVDPCYTHTAVASQENTAGLIGRSQTVTFTVRGRD